MGMFKQALCREMRTFDAIWHERRLTLGEVLQILISREAIIFLSLITLTLLALDPHKFLSHMTVWRAGIIWICAETCFSLVYFTLLGISLITKPHGTRVIFLPVYSVASFAASTLVAENLVQLLSNGQYIASFWPDFLLFAALAEIFEFLFIHFALDDILKQRRAGPENAETTQAADTTAPPTERVLHIGEWQAATSTLESIMSQQHYLHITPLQGEPTVLRGRMSDVLDQLDDTCGIHPHRSWWVSRAAEPSLISANKKRWLVTSSGARIPVSRGRTAAVQAWAAKDDQITPAKGAPATPKAQSIDPPEGSGGKA